MRAVLIVMQILDVNPEDENEEDGANVDLDSQRKGKCVVLKTSTRQVSVKNTTFAS
jgi:26S proteasome regulatory subunit T5